MTRNKLLIMIFLIISGCNDQKNASESGESPPQEVGFVTLHSRPVEMTNDLTGRVNATMTSDVRPQINGIIKQRYFTEGSEVKAGQLLYQIEPSLYQAAYDQAKAQLNNAQATEKSSRLKAVRYKELVRIKGVSQQDADDATASYMAIKASVAQYQAALESAQINLDFTRVTAPISGRIGISSVTPGALVTANQTSALATIRALDHVYVDLTQSSSQLLRLRKQQALYEHSKVTPVTLTLEDGSRYGHIGQLELTEVAVDVATGSVTLRAVFPNPDRQLLPGMFVRAQVAAGTDPNAFLVPQQGITRDAKGQATALIIDTNNKVEQRTVNTDRAIGNEWLVTDGIKNGDRLIVEGTSKVVAGNKVKPVEVKIKWETTINKGED